MRDFVVSIEAEYRRYKALGEAAMAQLNDAELGAAEGASANPVTVIVWHLGGNLASRFTDFLTTDGEKPWRNRDDEFAARTAARTEVMARWERGWSVLFEALAQMTDADLARTITIRSQPMRVHEALHRSLAHASYHVGQIVHIAKQHRGETWHSLSIPPGQSVAYNLAPTRETPAAHAAKLAPPERG